VLLVEHREGPVSRVYGHISSLLRYLSTGTSERHQQVCHRLNTGNKFIVISRINYDPNRTPRTPDDMKLPPPPQKSVMPYFYPVVYRKLLEVLSVNNIDMIICACFSFKY
jgi:hypothetical protein